MTTQHTSGPWKVVPSWDDFMVKGPNGEEIIWQDGAYDTPTISKADALLIAAAPDLLEALQPMVKGLHWITYDDVKRARAAIAKATGELK